MSWAGTRPSEIVDGRYDSHDPGAGEGAEEARHADLAALALGDEPTQPAQDEILSAERLRRGLEAHPDIFDDVGTDNVDWVWCPSANGFEETEGAEYYPGDDEVEWLCADAYTPYPNTPLEQRPRAVPRLGASHRRRTSR